MGARTAPPRYTHPFQAYRMKRFLIQYTFHPESGPEAAWHLYVANFIAALDSDPELKGRIRYRCMKARDRGDYFHIAEVSDDVAAKILQQREFFKHYTAETNRVSGGTLKVIPLEMIAESP